MREILFRGKNVCDGEWIYGYYAGPAGGRNNFHEIRDNSDSVGAWIDVNPDTIGQYTGLKDKNGKRIFEGDIVRYSVIVRDCLLYQGTLKVVFERGSFCIEETDSGDTHTLYNNAAGVELEVIGNIHDNTELLKEV